MNWSTTTDSLFILNELIQTNQQTYIWYSRAAMQAGSEGRGEAFRRLAERHRSFAEELLQRVATLGGHFAIHANRLDDAADAPADSGPNPAGEARRAHVHARTRYQEALAEPADPDTHRLLQDQYRAIDPDAERPERTPAVTAE